jgi:hypothetical protein
MFRTKKYFDLRYGIHHLPTTGAVTCSDILRICGHSHPIALVPVSPFHFTLIRLRCFIPGSESSLMRGSGVLGDY